MDQMILGVLVGAVSIGLVGAVAWLVVTLRDIAQKVAAAVNALNRAVLVFSKSSDMSATLSALTVANRKLLFSIDAMTAAIKVFNGMVFQPPEEPGEAPPDWTGPAAPRGPAWKPPAPPFVNEYANLDASGILSQSDEELSELEFQREAEARGEPTEADILGAQTEADIRGEV